MAFFQYLNFDGVDLPLPDNYEVDMEDKEADSGEDDAGSSTCYHSRYNSGTSGCDDVFKDGLWNGL